MFKRTVAAVIALAVALCLTICRVDAAPEAVRHMKDDNWLVYIYICGTDLEEGGLASQSLEEMRNVSLPPNVNVLIYANGAINWQHELIEKKGPGIYRLYSGGLSKLSSWKADMGKPDTLKKFLKFGEKIFNPDHRIIVFWDHGGVNGLCYDSAFDLTSKPEFQHNLTFYDLNKVFKSVYGHSDKKPFELVGFNTCMSASYELANSISDYSRYMVGSEPSENGWFFYTWLAALAENPAMNGAAIGQLICDGNMNRYRQRYENIREKYGVETADLYNVEQVNAFSVIDLSKMPKLRKAYENYFAEANKRSVKERGFSGAFARAASGGQAERYSNSYTDLSILAENTSNILPEASAELIAAIDEAVFYNRPGSYLRGKGISTYYPYALGNFNNFLTQKATPSSQKSLYKNLLKLDVSNLSGLPIKENSLRKTFLGAVSRQ